MNTSVSTRIGAEIATRKRRRVRIGIAVGVMVVLLVGAGVALWLSGGASSFGFDPASKAGQVPTKTPEERQAELNRIVDEGMFNISIASTIDFADPTSPGVAYIENVPGNHYDMQVDITLDDTGEVLYQSGAIAPGNFIETIELARTLPSGSHKATATFTALDRDTHEHVGEAAARVVLAIGEG